MLLSFLSFTGISEEERKTALKIRQEKEERARRKNEKRKLRDEEKERKKMENEEAK